MQFNEATLFAFLLVFVRCSAMLLASPIFGSATTPLQVRVLTCVAIAGALTVVLAPKLGTLPTSLMALSLTVTGEALAGLLIGSLMTLVLNAAQTAGGILDLQIGLSMSQTLNPVSGISVTVLAQFKHLLAMTIFLTSNAHHFLILGLVDSYRVSPSLGASSLPAVHDGVISLIASTSLLAIQISAPVLAVSIVVDAAIGLISKAVPQMQAIQVATPAKLALGMLALSISLPPLVNGVTGGCAEVYATLHKIFGAGH